MLDRHLRLEECGLTHAGRAAEDGDGGDCRALEQGDGDAGGGCAIIGVPDEEATDIGDEVAHRWLGAGQQDQGTTARSVRYITESS